MVSVDNIQHIRLSEEEFLRLAEINIAALNAATADLPADKVGCHVAILPVVRCLKVFVSDQNAFVLGQLAWTSS